MNSQVVKSIKLTNFRSHAGYLLDCTNNTTQILGTNGSGKTSVLEAIYIALQGKSFRATDVDILKRGADYYRVELGYTSGEKVTITYEKDSKKSFLVKDKKSTRLSKKQKYPVILFLPEDLHLLSSSPTRRRDYFDRVISQLNQTYSTTLSRYNKAMKQRNILLKQEFVSRDSLFSWDVMLAKYGAELRKSRSEVVSEINSTLTDIYRTIAKNQDSVELKYKSYTEQVSESEYLRLLQLDYERDTITGHTNFGVHKDDYEFYFNGSLADGSASRGEVRSIILALKFIEAHLIEEKLGVKPLVLLDDVFSELDHSRQQSLVKNFSSHQVILTSVEGIN